MNKITIKSKYNNKGEKYFFAENETGLLFGVFCMGGFAFTNYTLGYAWQYPDLESLEKDLKEYKKTLKKEKIEKIIEI